MFAAALMFSCAGCEVSIYSTCKRISTKLLRNVTMFLGIIYDVLKIPPHKVCDILPAFLERVVQELCL